MAAYTVPQCRSQNSQINKKAQIHTHGRSLSAKLNVLYVFHPYLLMLKRTFISLYILLISLMAIHSLYGMIVSDVTGELIAWAGAAFSSLSVLLYFCWLFNPKVARTKAHYPSMSAMTAAGLCVVSLGSWCESRWLLLPLFYASISLTGWLLYDYWYSNLNRSQSKSIAYGEQLPSFQLQNYHGGLVPSDHFLDSLTIFLFYRGNWCPLCTTQIQELALKYQQLHERGVKVALVSPQPHVESAKLANKVNVPFYFLVDVKSKVAKMLGIYAKNGVPLGLELLGYDQNTLMPTLIITDKKNTIIHCDETQNYRVRPEPETLIKAIDEYLLKANSTAKSNS